MWGAMSGLLPALMSNRSQGLPGLTPGAAPSMDLGQPAAGAPPQGGFMGGPQGNMLSVLLQNNLARKRAQFQGPEGLGAGMGLGLGAGFGKMPGMFSKMPGMAPPMPSDNPVHTMPVGVPQPMQPGMPQNRVDFRMGGGWLRPFNPMRAE